MHLYCGQSGSTDVVALLEPFPADVTACDSDGNTCVHVAASSADYFLVKVGNTQRGWLCCVSYGAS